MDSRIIRASLILSLYLHLHHDPSLGYHIIASSIPINSIRTTAVLAINCTSTNRARHARPTEKHLLAPPLSLLLTPLTHCSTTTSFVPFAFHPLAGRTLLTLSQYDDEPQTLRVSCSRTTTRWCNSLVGRGLELFLSWSDILLFLADR